MKWKQKYPLRKKTSLGESLAKSHAYNPIRDSRRHASRTRKVSPRVSLTVLHVGFANSTEAADDRANISLSIAGDPIVGHCSADYWYANSWFADYRPILSLPLSRHQLACQL